MEVKIVPLAKTNINDWLNFFDERAFEDHKEWKTCYCTFYHYPKLDDYDNKSKRKRDYAIWLIFNNKLKGYLAYKDEKVIAFCNVNNKTNYSRLCNLDPSSDKILSIVCFIVQKNERRKGIATLILQKIISDAKSQGYKQLEAYPTKSETDYGNFHGPYDLYINMGFELYKAQNQMIVKKML